MEKRKIKKVRLRKGRAFAALAIAGMTVAGGNIGIRNLADRFGSNYKNSGLVDTNDVFGYKLDNFDASEYKFNEEISIHYMNENGEMNLLYNLPEGACCTIYDENIIRDKNNEEYFYCNNTDYNIIGLIKSDDLTKGYSVGEKLSYFSSIFVVDSGKKNNDVSLNSYCVEDSNENKVLHNGDVLFVNEIEYIKDKKGNTWSKARTSDGDIGYIEINKNLKKIKEVSLMQVEKTTDINSHFGSNLSQNTDMLVTQIDTGDRVLVIGDCKQKNLSNIVYFDDKGIARSGNISNNLLKKVDLESFKKFENEKENQNEKIDEKMLLEQNISEWSEDINGKGCKGIDVSYMAPGALADLLSKQKDIEYGIVRIGSTGYGIFEDGLKFSSDITTSDTDFELAKNQIAAFKNAGKKVLVYYYTTENTIEECDIILDKIKKSIDKLGGGFVPVIDCEYESDYKEDDRRNWVNKPNYEKYLMNGGSPVNFDEVYTFKNYETGKFDEIGLNDYVKNNANASEYIRFCQTEKAKCIAYMYKNLYDSGYMKTNNVLLYSGNSSFSKNTFMANVDYYIDEETKEKGWYESIVLAKLDEVQYFLTDPESPYYVPDGLNIKMWYADYTDCRNDKMFNNDCAMLQTAGDVKYEDYEYGQYECGTYDKVNGCREFIEAVIDEKIKSNEEVQYNFTPKTYDDDLELR